MNRLTNHKKWSDDIDLKEEHGYKYIYDRLAEYENTGLSPDEINGWIRVKDGLPKEWQRENGEPIEFNVMRLGAKEATTLCYNGSQWFEFDWKNMKVVGCYTVTHWMPLPDPPKGVSK